MFGVRYLSPRYRRRAKRLDNAGWYRSITNCWVDRHAVRIIHRWEIATMSDDEFEKLFYPKKWAFM